MKARCMAAVAVLTLGSASWCAAHPGHGAPGTENTVTHYVTEPVHSMPWMAAAAAGTGILIGVGARMFARHRGATR